MKKHFTISASSVKKWIECPRRWARERIEGVKEPQGEKAALGTRCHSITEEYLTAGTAPNQFEVFEIGARRYYPGQIASNIFQHLPPAGAFEPGTTERKFEFEIGGHKVTGYKDAEKRIGDALRIYDHKFTSSLQYAMTAAELAADIQCEAYLEDVWTNTDEPRAEAQWTYGTFDVKRSHPVVVSFQRDREKLKRRLPVFDAMAKAYDTIVDAKDLPKNLNSCNLYGKQCFHAEWCGINHSDRVAQIMNSAKIAATKGRVFMASDALKLLQARQAAARAAANGGTSAPVTAPAVAPVPVPTPTINPPGEAEIAAKYLLEQAEIARVAAQVAAVTETAKVRKPRAAKAQSVEAPVAVAEPPVMETRIKTLYINCMPLKGERLVSAHDLISEAHTAVLEEVTGISHYAFIEFGKARGALSVGVLGALDARPNCDVYVDTGSPEGRDCLEALAGRANQVVRGF